MTHRVLCPGRPRLSRRPSSRRARKGGLRESPEWVVRCYTEASPGDASGGAAGVLSPRRPTAERTPGCKELVGVRRYGCTRFLTMTRRSFGETLRSKRSQDGDEKP